MPAALHNLPPLRAVLQRHNIQANKSFGQHFLFDLNLTDKIAGLAAPHHTIIEIGPGPGALSRSLLLAGAQDLIAIEKDARFLPILEDIKSASKGRLHIVQDDALKIDLAELSPARPLRICANLPYNVGTKLLVNWLNAQPIYWDKIVVMLQKEVAMRVVAKAGDNAYGRLSVLAASVARCTLAFDVPARAFTPPPKVDSAVIVLDALPPSQRFSELSILAKITAAAFGQRRKMLRKSLKPLAKTWKLDLADWLDNAGIEADIRPETLSVSGFHALANIAATTSAHS